MLKANRFTKRKSRITSKYNYFYETGNFQKVLTNSEMLKQDITKKIDFVASKTNSNKSIRVKINEKLFTELKLFGIKGSKEIEITEDEIYLRDIHANYLNSCVCDLYFADEYEELRKNKDELDKKMNELNDESYSINLIKYKKEKMLETNLRDNESLKIIFIDKPYKDSNGKAHKGRLLFQITKIQKKDGRKKIYLHKASKIALNAFYRIIQNS